jgi:hypothetical protein
MRRGADIGVELRVMIRPDFTVDSRRPVTGAGAGGRRIALTNIPFVKSYYVLPSFNSSL